MPSSIYNQRILLRFYVKYDKMVLGEAFYSTSIANFRRLCYDTIIKRRELCVVEGWGLVLSELIKASPFAAMCLYFVRLLHKTHIEQLSDMKNAYQENVEALKDVYAKSVNDIKEVYEKVYEKSNRQPSEKGNQSGVSE